MGPNPVREEIPAWYEMGAPDFKTLVVRIHQKAMMCLREINWSQAPICAHLQSGLGLEPFIGPDQNSWGFGGILIRQDESDPEWEKLTCTLPVIRTEEVSATGRRIGQQQALALRASLAILFLGLELFEENTGAALPQLLVIDNIRVDLDLHGGSLSAAVTPALCRWLSQQSHESTLREVVEVMRKADHHMWPTDVHNYERFEALCRQPKWINLDVPGNACGLDPADYYDQSLDHGYRLVPHNVDGSLQQLTLLMGLAKVHGLARSSQ